MDIDLQELPGPAPHYITIAMANSDYRSKRCAWPISGDHSARSQHYRNNIDISNYIHLATRRYV